MPAPEHKNPVNHHDEGKLRILAAATNDSRRQAPQSTIFFTTHKCASTFVSQFLPLVTRIGNLKHLDYAKDIYGLGNEISAIDPFEFMSLNSDFLFSPTGEIYGPIRRPVSIKNLSKFKAIFFLRDPRDVAVSAYHSFGFSHVLPTHTERREKFLKEREKIKQEGIDQYALRAVEEWILPTFGEYANLYDEAGKSIFISYDQYIDNPRELIGRTLSFMEIEGFPENIVTQLANLASPIQKTTSGKNPQHKRSGRSRQFDDELKPETIGQLNHLLSDVLNRWDFRE